MAHELTLRKDGRYEMAFVGVTPWHGLGQNVSKDAPIATWAKAAGMDWDAYTDTPAVTRKGVVGRTVDQLITFDGYQGLYRSDTSEPLAIVGADYQVVQPRDVLEFMRGLTESGGWHIHTAGTMRGGRKLWALATCEDAVRFVRGYAGDKVALNLLLATSLDGSMKTTGILTTVRVVCANTLRLALAGGSGFAQVQLSHRSTFDADLIKAVLGLDSAHRSFDAFMEQARSLAETPIGLGEARDVLLKIFKPSNAVAGQNLSWMGNLAEVDTRPAEPAEGRATGRVLELFDGDGMGADFKTARATRWGLLNAVTQFVDHEMGRTPDTRLDAAWFGRGRDFKQHAVELLTEAS